MARTVPAKRLYAMGAMEERWSTGIELLLPTASPGWAASHNAWVCERLVTWSGRHDARPAPADVALLAVTLQFNDILEAITETVAQTGWVTCLAVLVKFAALTGLPPVDLRRLP